MAAATVAAAAFKGGTPTCLLFHVLVDVGLLAHCPLLQKVVSILLHRLGKENAELLRWINGGLTGCGQLCQLNCKHCACQLACMWRCVGLHASVAASGP